MPPSTPKSGLADGHGGQPMSEANMSTTPQLMVPLESKLPSSAALSTWKGTALLVLVFAVCFAWIVLTRLQLADDPLDIDLCNIILMGRVLAEGGKLYIDTCDHK